MSTHERGRLLPREETLFKPTVLATVTIRKERRSDFLAGSLVGLKLDQPYRRTEGEDRNAAPHTIKQPTDDPIPAERQKPPCAAYPRQEAIAAHWRNLRRMSPGGKGFNRVGCKGEAVSESTPPRFRA